MGSLHRRRLISQIVRSDAVEPGQGGDKIEAPLFVMQRILRGDCTSSTEITVSTVAESLKKAGIG